VPRPAPGVEQCRRLYKERLYQLLEAQRQVRGQRMQQQGGGLGALPHCQGQARQFASPLQAQQMELLPHAGLPRSHFLVSYVHTPLQRSHRRHELQQPPQSSEISGPPHATCADGEL
jgi:hypothetical protein